MIIIILLYQHIIDINLSFKRTIGSTWGTKKYNIDTYII